VIYQNLFRELSGQLDQTGQLDQRLAQRRVAFEANSKLVLDCVAAVAANSKRVLAAAVAARSTIFLGYVPVAADSKLVLDYVAVSANSKLVLDYVAVSAKVDKLFDGCALFLATSCTRDLTCV